MWTILNWHVKWDFHWINVFNSLSAYFKGKSSWMISQRDLPILTTYFSSFIDTLGKELYTCMIIFLKPDIIFLWERPYGTITKICVKGSECALSRKKKVDNIDKLSFKWNLIQVHKGIFYPILNLKNRCKLALN